MSHQLRQAAAKGDLAKVQACLARHDDVNAPHGYSGRTALTEAAIAGHLDVARLLLDHGAEIHWRDRAVGMTPLGWASDCGHPALVELFLQRGADPNRASDEFLISPLMWAAGKGHEAIVRMLLDAGANVGAAASDGRTALTFAKTQKRDEIVKLLISAGGKENVPVQPAKMAWPAVDETGRSCEHSTPEAVLRGFTFAMNRWERYVAKLDGSKKPEKVKRKELLDSMQAIFDLFCTAKKRPYGRLGSYRTPPEYDPKDESLIAVNMVSAARAELTTRCDKPHQHEYLYVVLKKKGRWLLDNKKTRLIGGKWMQWFL
jgi:uncharacterized protein